MGICIAGTGKYLPEHIAANSAFEAFVDTSDEWIRTRSGMQERHISMGEPTWRMGELAARQALEDAGVPPEEVDVILCTTVTPDYQYPSVACLIQGALGATNAFAMDINAACTGSVYALDMARRYLLTGMETVLLVGAETLSQATDYTDRSTCVLFGDGAGAAVLRRGDGLYGSFLRSDPSGLALLYLKHKRRKTPFGEDLPFEGELFQAEREGDIVMKGQDIYKFATRAMPLAVKGACQEAGVALDELDLIIPHQANLRIIETAAKNLRVSMDKICVNIHKYGNTSSASPMIGLDECIREGRLREGGKFCMVGFGAGLTYGAIVTQYHRKMLQGGS